MSETAAFLTEIGILVGIMTPVIVSICALINGMRCVLRSEILRIYYNRVDSRCLRQYEMENVVFLYKAYKALGGNSFIDKIYKEIITWSVKT